MRKAVIHQWVFMTPSNKLIRAELQAPQGASIMSRARYLEVYDEDGLSAEVKLDPKAKDLILDGTRRALMALVALRQKKANPQ